MQVCSVAIFPIAFPAIISPCLHSYIVYWLRIEIVCDLAMNSQLQPKVSSYTLQADWEHGRVREKSTTLTHFHHISGRCIYIHQPQIYIVSQARLFFNVRGMAPTGKKRLVPILRKRGWAARLRQTLWPSMANISARGVASYIHHVYSYQFLTHQIWVVSQASLFFHEGAPLTWKKRLARKTTYLGWS